MSRWMMEQRLLSTESTFRKALKSDKFYEDFVKDFNRITEEDCIVQTPVLYNNIFDCENMTEGRLKLHKTKEYESFLCNAFVNDPCKNRHVWLPNSDDTFACSQRNPLTVLQIYDKDFNVLETIPDGTPGCKYLNMFHPFKAAFTSVSQAGYIKVFA